MKIKISYLPEESEKAKMIERAIKKLFDGVSTKCSCKHPPFKHIYMKTPKKPLH